jgi:hypothetical protein
LAGSGVGFGGAFRRLRGGVHCLRAACSVPLCLCALLYAAASGVDGSVRVPRPCGAPPLPTGTIYPAGIGSLHCWRGMIEYPIPDYPLPVTQCIAAAARQPCLQTQDGMAFNAVR